MLFRCYSLKLFLYIHTIQKFIQLKLYSYLTANEFREQAVAEFF